MNIARFICKNSDRYSLFRSTYNLIIPQIAFDVENSLIMFSRENMSCLEWKIVLDHKKMLFWYCNKMRIDTIIKSALSSEQERISLKMTVSEQGQRSQQLGEQVKKNAIRFSAQLETEFRDLPFGISSILVTKVALVIALPVTVYLITTLYKNMKVRSELDSGV